VPVRALSWNLFHGRDFPPDPSLLTWRSRLFRISERNETHLQVNRDLFDEFASLLAGADWDLALLQECPPRRVDRLAAACAARSHLSLTSRNSLAPLRALAARLNPDLVASAEGGANLTLIRGRSITERDEIVLATAPERRTMALTRTDPGLAVANLHASTAQASAARELLTAAAAAVSWAGESPLVFGGDFNLRPESAPKVFAELRELGFTAPTAPDAIDHLLARGLATVDPPARWPPERREVRAGALAIRLSDHAPVETSFT
jgi:endonuclease/exonuclease/phosphatase family metal-dependent hydrolase